MIDLNNPPQSEQIVVAGQETPGGTGAVTIVRRIAGDALVAGDSANPEQVISAAEGIGIYSRIVAAFRPHVKS